MDCEDWPTLEVESPQNPRDLRVNVRKLQHLPGLPLDSLGSTGQPGSTSDFSFQQRVATKHWRTVRAQLKAHTFILGLQKKQQAKESEKEEEGDEEGEYYNIHSSSEQSSPKSPNAAGWTQNPHVQLLQSQLEEATEEIERLYTEKEDVEHLLHEVRRNSSRSSIRLEHIPTPMSPERVSVACQCEEMPPSVPSPMGRRAFSKTPVSPLSPEVDDEERLDRRDLLEFERRLFLEDAAAWEIERTELEDKQAQLEGEVANALREAEEAAERVNLQEVQMEMWRNELAQAREQEEEVHYRASMHFSLRQENMWLAATDHVEKRERLVVMRCFFAWRSDLDLKGSSKAALSRVAALDILSRLQIEQGWLLLGTCLMGWYQTWKLGRTCVTLYSHLMTVWCLSW
ncbi:unnamed protein product [Durusdinium trenchii]|uniref:Uncharacterized protein n=1 Tax=Durusdinium trenchii TaxID=1381693 RepID=A0ABP0K112_9DINO